MGKEVDVNFINCVRFPVVVFVCAIKIKNYRNIVFGKIIMIASEIKTVAVAGDVVCVIKFKFCNAIVHTFAYLMKVGA